MHPTKILLWHISHSKPILQLQIIIQRIPIALSWESLCWCSNKNPSVEHGAPTFVGEYYESCKIYARENEDEMNHNNISLDNLLKSQPSTYGTGENRHDHAGLGVGLGCHAPLSHPD